MANIATTAKETEDGQFYVVNGEKMYITGGMKAAYFTVAVRTINKEGVPHKNISLMVIEKAFKGVYTSRMKTQGWLTSTTTYVVFRNVKVPKSHIIGKAC